jgi:hypothetical protein
MVPLCEIHAICAGFAKGEHPKMSIALFQGRFDEVNSFIPRSKPNILRALMFVCPLFFTGFVAFKSRTSQDPYQIPSGTPAQDARVLAYAPYVAQTQELVRGQEWYLENRTQLLALCMQWDEAVRKEELKPVFPVSFEDVPEEGARNSIVRAKSQLVSFLLTDAHRQFKRGQNAQAVEESLLAMRLSESLKYSDFASVYRSANEQKRAVALLESHLDSADPEQRAKIAGQLEQIRADRANLDAMTRYSRIQYYDWLKRMHKDEIKIEDVHRMVLVTHRITTDPTSKDTLRYIKSAIVEGSGEDSPEYLSQLRLAYSSERSNQHGIARLSQQL